MPEINKHKMALESLIFGTTVRKSRRSRPTLTLPNNAKTDHLLFPSRVLLTFLPCLPFGLERLRQWRDLTTDVRIYFSLGLGMSLYITSPVSATALRSAILEIQLSLVCQCIALTPYLVSTYIYFDDALKEFTKKPIRRGCAGRSRHV